MAWNVLVGRGLIQGNAQVNLDARPGDSNLLDQEADEPLTLLEVEGIDTLSNTPGEGVDLARQPVVDHELLVLRQKCLALLLELSMAADHLVLPELEFGELNGLHLIEVHEPSALCFGALQPTFQAFELSPQQLIIGLLRVGAECRLALHQDLRPQQRLAQLIPHQRVKRLSPSRGLRARPFKSTCLERSPLVAHVIPSARLLQQAGVPGNRP